MNEHAHLTLNVVHDHDGDIRVTASIVSESFSGSSGAWFQEPTVTEFVSAMRALSESGAGSAALVATFFEPKGIETSPLAITIFPWGKLGHLLITARLVRTPSFGPYPPRAMHQVEAAFGVEPSALNRFARELSRFPIGTIAEGTIVGESAV